MSTWILILTLITNNTGSTIQTIENFSNETACNIAGEEFLKQTKKVNNNEIIITYTCVTLESQDKITVENIEIETLLQTPILKFDQSAKDAANAKVSKYLTDNGYAKAPKSHKEAADRLTLKKQLEDNGFNKVITDKINTTYISKEDAENLKLKNNMETYATAVESAYNGSQSIQDDFDDDDFNSFKEGITIELNKNKDLSGKLIPKIKANIISEYWQELKKSKGK